MESGDNIRGTGGCEGWQECMNRRETRELLGEKWGHKGRVNYRFVLLQTPGVTKV